MNKLILPFIFLLGVMFLNSCSSDDSPVKPEVTEDTTAATGKSAILNTSKGIINCDFGEGVFTSSTILTKIILAPKESFKNGTNTVEMIFRGDAPGTYVFNTLNSVAIKIKDTLYTSVSGYAEITEYGGVGGLIKGSFSGEFKNAGSNKTITVTVSYFTAKRIASSEVDPNDNNSVTLSLNVLFENQNKFEIKNKNYIGNSEYLDAGSYKLVTIGLADVSTGTFSIAGSGQIGGLFDNQVIAFLPSDGLKYLLIKIDNITYWFKGNLTMTKAAIEIGKYFEFQGSGELIEPNGTSKVATVNEFKLKIIRKS